MAKTPAYFMARERSGRAAGAAGLRAILAQFSGGLTMRVFMVRAIAASMLSAGFVGVIADRPEAAHPGRQAGAKLPAAFPRAGTTQILENDRVVIWRLDWTKARPTVMHAHATDMVAVVIEGGRVSARAPDGTVQSRDFTPGDTLFQPRGVIHVEELEAPDTARSISIELKDGPVPTRPRNASAPEGFPRDGARLVVENARVAVWDYTWRADRPVGLHIHNRDTVVVPVTAGEIRVQFRGGETRISRLVPGEVMYFSGADAHSEEAISGSPRAIVVELK